MTAVIETRAMCTGYVGQAVVHDLDLVVNEGEVVCLLGPNGAGKTTTMLALSRRAAADLRRGAGRRQGDDLTPLHRRAHNGMSYVTEERSVFKGLRRATTCASAGLDPDEATVSSSLS